MTEFRTPDEESAGFRRRVVVAGLFVVLCLGLLGARFYYLQVVKYDYFHTRAEDNRIALLPVVPNRGTIYDRNGVVLARNYAAYTLEITPSRVRNLDETIDALAEVVEIDARDRRRFKKLLEESKRFESVPIRTRLTDEEVARFVARRYQFPGVEVQARLFRDYPHGEAASHVIGYIGRINQRDLERIEERGETPNYRGSDYIGKSGVELSYEAELHGTTGVEQVEVNAGGRAVRLMSHTPAVAGNDLVLSLDIELQKVAEAAFGARRGALVAIDPRNGEVLALVSKPTFDPNLFVDGISTADWKALNESPDHPLLHRAINSTYPPGSTFKPFMALAGLESGRRRVGQTFSGQGVYTFAGNRFVDSKASCQSGVDLHRTLVASCNVYYYQLANDLGIDAIAGFMRPFRFGSLTGIDLPGESEGVLPSPEWKRKRFRTPAQQKWFGGETLSIGIGQGYSSYTPLQMASALATLVNGGVMYRPHLAKRVIDTRTGERPAVTPEPAATLSFNKAHLAAIRAAMADVTRVGTAARAFQGAPYTSGGKTGTAQVFSLRGAKYVEGRVAERLRDHSWFITYAPADEPRIVLAVLVENGGFGSTSAAPLARQVLDFHLLGNRADAPAREDEEEAAADL